MAKQGTLGSGVEGAHFGSIFGLLLSGTDCYREGCKCATVSRTSPLRATGADTKAGFSGRFQRPSVSKGYTRESNDSALPKERDIQVLWGEEGRGPNAGCGFPDSSAYSHTGRSEGRTRVTVGTGGRWP